MKREIPEAFQNRIVKSVKRSMVVGAASVAVLVFAVFAWQVATAFRLRNTEDAWSNTLAALLARKVTEDEIIATVRERLHHEMVPPPDAGFEESSRWLIPEPSVDFVSLNMTRIELSIGIHLGPDRRARSYNVSENLIAP